MALRTICVALLLSTLPAAGCGTVANLVKSPSEDGGRPFGGVRQDVMCIKQAANGESAVKTRPKSEAEHYPRVAILLFCSADLPLSLVADVVLWPYMAVYNYINQPIPTPPVTQVLPEGQPQASR